MQDLHVAGRYTLATTSLAGHEEGTLQEPCIIGLKKALRVNSTVRQITNTRDFGRKVCLLIFDEGLYTSYSL